MAKALVAYFLTKSVCISYGLSIEASGDFAGKIVARP